DDELLLLSLREVDDVATLVVALRGYGDTMRPRLDGKRHTEAPGAKLDRVAQHRGVRGRSRAEPQGELRDAGLQRRSARDDQRVTLVRRGELLGSFLEPLPGDGDVAALLLAVAQIE